ncbi:MAG: hypothetical protein KY468_18720 [Armatimonadetes bacterium]|nr:hypothetical protein [Armatimonadota bacterium]
MTPEEAKELLSFHSGRHEDIHHPKWDSGFLGMLRPYRGLIEENFHEVMEALQVLAPELHKDAVDAKLMDNLWAICFLAKMWGLDKRSALQRDGLITHEDTERLSDWINQIAYAVMILIDSGDVNEAFAGYVRRSF